MADTAEGSTEAARARLKELLKSRRWRLSNLYFIEDKDGQNVLFKPNQVQLQVDENLHNRNVILKSRQHGITTWACIRALDTALFRSHSACGIVAHTKDDALKFFRRKILYAYDRLPEWLRKARPIVRKDMDGEVEFGNSSRIEVGVSLRGGTYQRVHVSELGPMCAMYPQRAAEVISGALNTANTSAIITVESTAHGAVGDFFAMCQRAMELDRLVAAGKVRLTALDYRFFFLSWWEDPTNVLHEHVEEGPELQDYFTRIEAETRHKLRPEQRAWYAKKLAEQEDKMFSQFPSTPAEAFRSSVEGSYYGKFIDKAEIEGRVCDLPFIPGIPVNTFWDLGKNDTTAIWFHQEVGPWHHFIDYYENSGEGAEHYARILRDLQDRRGFVYGHHFLPHDAEVSDWSIGETRKRSEILEALGVRPLLIVPRVAQINEGIEAVRQVLPRCRFDRTRCGEDPPGSGRGGLPALRSYQKTWSMRGQTWMDHPLHNWASNGADAFRQFAQGYRTGSRPGGGDDRRTRSTPSAGVPKWKVA